MDKNRPKTLEEVTLEVARKYGRYEAEAYRFVFEALDHLLHHMAERRHVTGAELSTGIRDLAIERFGMLARTVLESWGVHATHDFGEMVYQLIEEGVMSRTDEDRKEDFDNVFDFHEAFDRDYFKTTGK